MKFRRLIIAFLIALISVSLPGGNISYARRPQKTVRILAIGNSFSVDAIEQNFYELAKAEGINVIVGNMYIGGCSLARHVKNIRGDIADYSYRKIVDGKKTTYDHFTIDKVLADEKWDYVSFQQASPYSGQYGTYARDLPELVSHVRARVSGKTKFMLFMTWAYASDCSRTAFSNYDRDQMKMYKAILDANKRAAKLVGIHIIIPCGTAIQNARTSFIGDHMNRDGYHLDKSVGRYTAACTWCEKIFGKSIAGNPYSPAGLPADRKEVAQKAAHAAVRHPFRVTAINVKLQAAADNVK
jgi:hypothetical protein